MGSKSTKTKRDPEPGDLIEISRWNGIYQHWAVFIGDGYVVHLKIPKGTNAGDCPQLELKKSIVAKEKLRDVVQNKDWKVNNILDKEYDPLDVYDIVEKALRMVGIEIDYDVVFNNCEHFATNLRYDKGKSRQVDKAVAIAAVGVTAGLVGAAAIVTVKHGRKIRQR